MRISVKSEARRTMRTLSMLPPASPITLAIWASVPGSLSAVTLMRAGKRWGVSGSMSQVTSIQPSCSNSRRRGRVDLEDADALAGDQHPDDAVAGHGAARLEGHGQVVLDAADGEPAADCPSAR